MAAAIELKGSRQERLEGKMWYGSRIFAGTAYDDTTAAIGAIFTGQSGSPDTDNANKRVAISVGAMPDKLPGIFYFEVQYAGFRPYT